MIEIGILRVERGICVETYRTYVNPGHLIPPWITTLTGIQQQELDEAPLFEDVIDDVHRLLSGAIFVAHNVHFDHGFIAREFAQAGRTFNTDILCTVRISRALYSREKRHNLSSLIARHGFVCESRHRALDDARVLWDFLQLCAVEQPTKLAAVIKRLTHAAPLIRPSYRDSPYEEAVIS